MEKSPFDTYLLKKKIDPDLFKAGDPKTYASFEQLFDEVHENSFTAQKLFLINALRRRYTYMPGKTEAEAPPPTRVKPKMIVKAKMK